MSARALGLMVMTFLVTSFGTTTLAAYGVGSNILQVVIIPAMGLSMAVSALAGQNIGAGNVARASSIGRLGAGIPHQDSGQKTGQKASLHAPS